MRTQLPSSARTTRLAAAAGLAAAVVAVAPGGAAAAALKAGTGLVGETAGGHVALILSSSGREVTHAFIGYTQKCSDGGNLTDWDAFKSLPISSKGTFRAGYDTGPQTTAALPGVTIEVIGALAGKVNKARTSAKGTARFSVSFKAADGTTKTCDTGPITYSVKN